MAGSDGDSRYFDTIKVDFEGFWRRQPPGISGRKVDDEADGRLAHELAAANSEPPDLDQAGQSGRRPDPQSSGHCVEMDTVISDQNGRRQLPTTPRQDQVERQPRLAGA